MPTGPAYRCTACDWAGTEPATTHSKDVRETDGGLQVVHTHHPICPKCFEPVRITTPC